LMSNEIRDAHDIEVVAPDTIVLTSLNTQLGFDVKDNPGLFDTATRLRITYKYEEQNGKRFLLKTTDLAIPVSGKPAIQRKYLENMIEPVVAGKPETAIFSSPETAAPFQTIRVNGRALQRRK